MRVRMHSLTARLHLRRETLFCPRRTRRLLSLVLLLLGVGIATMPQSAQAWKPTWDRMESAKDSIDAIAEGYALHRATQELYHYRVMADSTVQLRQGRLPTTDSTVVIPARTFRFIHERVRDHVLSDRPDAERFTLGYKGESLVLRLSQRFNLYILASLIVVVVVGGSLLGWLWWRLSRERRRRKALARSRHYLTKGREKERERLAQEIHDGPVQSLHGLHMQIKAVPKAPDLEEIGDELMRVTSELRAMSADLHPPALERFGLAAAIRSHADRLGNRRSSLQIDVDLAEDCPPMADEYALSLFRVAQEAMNNAVQHGEADHLHVTLRCSGNAVTLDVRDDGVGFTPPEDWHALAERDHYGLLGMRERAEAINATLDIESAPKSGTHVQLQASVEALEGPAGIDESAPVPA